VKNKPSLTAIVITTIAAVLLSCGSAGAQNNTDKGLSDQLMQQYKLSDTILVVQKDGILAVPSTQTVAGESTYKDGTIHPPGTAQRLFLGTVTRNFPLKDKVHVTRLNASVKKDKVVMLLAECAVCNGNDQEFVAFVVFQFPKGYLASADAGQIEDVISQVLTIDAGNAQPEQAAAPPAESQASGPPALTNDDIIKMVQAQLPDSVIIAKIKSSTCAFDTSPDALIGLKKAGTSPSVLLAMTEASTAQPAAPDNAGPPAADPAVCEEYNSCLKNGLAAFQSSQWDQSLTYFEEASNLDPSRGDAWAMIGYAYFELGRYDEALGMSDKALQLGATLIAKVCRVRGLGCDLDSLRMSTKEISLVNWSGHKVFAAPTSDITSQGAQLSVTGNSAYLPLLISGKSYNLFLVPEGLTCETGLTVECPEPGFTQQKVFANYVHQAIVKITAGSFTPRPN
jgi:tetratricopeptide (TPR) repeat protein